MTAAALVAVEAPPARPFRGLEPLRFIDQPIFTGRERETEQLRRLVVIYRAVLLYGDSGTGKSSLLNAGLIPAVGDVGLRPERLRVQPRAREELVVERISRAEDGAAPYLPSAFIDGDAPSAVFSVPQFRRRLLTLADEALPLLVFDQFEELITLFQEAASPDAPSDRRRLQRGVVELLDELLGDGSIPVKLLFAFREDYLAKVLDLLAAHPQIKDQYVRLTPPTAETLREIVRGPFDRFPSAFTPELSPSLADALVDVVVGSGDRRSSTLSELQVACLRLWQSGDPDRLFEERGLQGLLEDELSAAIDRLDPSLRYAALALLGHMVTPSGARNVISEEDLISRAEADASVPVERLRRALSELERDTRLVRREVRHDVAFYEIVSEFLSPWIRRHRQRVELTRVQEAVAPDRLEDQIAWHERMSWRLRHQYQLLKLMQIVGAAAIPLVVAIPGAPRWVAAAFAALTLVLIVGEEFLSLQQRWVAYRSDAEALKREKYLFLTGGGPYSRAEAPQRLLSERVEALLARDDSPDRRHLDRPASIPRAPDDVRSVPAFQRADQAREWYLMRAAKAGAMSAASRSAQTLMLAAAAVLCVAEAFPNTRLAVGALGAGVVVLEGLQQAFQFRQRASIYRAAAEALAHELSLFLSGAGGYVGLPPGLTDRTLAERTEALISQESAVFTVLSVKTEGA